MKKRNMMLVTSLLLAVLLIGGGTFAWFTAETEAVDNHFVAGTLDIELIEEFCPPRNVNPGDCYEKDVRIKNIGSKYAVVRIAKEAVFEDMNGNPLWAGVVEYDLNDLYWFEKDGYFVYRWVLGTRSWNNTTKPLFDEICFDGELMTNDYQGSTFILTVKGEGIQATNEAPDQWGVSVGWLGYVSKALLAEGEAAPTIFDVEGTDAEPEQIGEVR